MFTLTSKMDSVCNVLRKWGLRNKKLWGINWRQFSNDLAIQGLEVDNLQRGNHYNSLVKESNEQALLLFQYWSQRMKELWVTTHVIVLRNYSFLRSKRGKKKLRF